MTDLKSPSAVPTFIIPLGTRHRAKCFTCMFYSIITKKPYNVGIILIPVSPIKRLITWLSYVPGEW